VTNSVTGIARSPSAPASTTRASSATSTGSESPAGLAVPRLPPIVPALRICGEPIVRAAAASAGRTSASFRSTSVHVTPARSTTSSSST
jgi:hypothetical protein